MDPRTILTESSDEALINQISQAQSQIGDNPVLPNLDPAMAEEFNRLINNLSKNPSAAGIDAKRASRIAKKGKLAPSHKKLREEQTRQKKLQQTIRASLITETLIFINPSRQLKVHNISGADSTSAGSAVNAAITRLLGAPSFEEIYMKTLVKSACKEAGEITVYYYPTRNGKKNPLMSKLGFSGTEVSSAVLTGISLNAKIAQQFLNAALDPEEKPIMPIPVHVPHDSSSSSVPEEQMSDDLLTQFVEVAQSS